MKKDTPRERIAKRRETSFKQLRNLVNSKDFGKNSLTSTYVKVGLDLGLTGQTVYNYVNGRGGDGYVIDALIEEFEKL